jgi:hypothetical protein
MKEGCTAARGGSFKAFVSISIVRERETRGGKEKGKGKERGGERRKECDWKT